MSALVPRIFAAQRMGHARPLVLLIAGVAGAAVAACTTGENMRDVSIGMNREQVVQILGRPDGDQVAGPFEALRYSDRLTSGWSWNRADYQVLLQDGRVTAYGPGAVRQDGPRLLVLVPLGR